VTACFFFVVFLGDFISPSADGTFVSSVKFNSVSRQAVIGLRLSSSGLRLLLFFFPCVIIYLGQNLCLFFLCRSQCSRALASGLRAIFGDPFLIVTGFVAVLFFLDCGRKQGDPLQSARDFGRWYPVSL